MVCFVHFDLEMCFTPQRHALFEHLNFHKRSESLSFSPNSVLLGVLNAFLRCPPWCWMVCLPSRGSCLPLSPFVSLLVSLCRMVCPPSRGSCLPLSPLVFPCLPCTPSCFPLLDGASAFPRVLSPLSPLVSLCLPLSPLASPCLPVGWCVRRVRLPAGLVSPCLPFCLPLSPFLFPKQSTVSGS